MEKEFKSVSGEDTVTLTSRGDQQLYVNGHKVIESSKARNGELYIIDDVLVA